MILFCSVCQPHRVRWTLLLHSIIAEQHWSKSNQVWQLQWQDKCVQLRKMASPFVPVPVPMDRTLSAGSNQLRRPQRASSLGSVSSSSVSSSYFTRSTGEEHGRGCGESGSQHQSRCKDRGNRSRTPPPIQSPVTRARVNGALEPSVEYSSCPRSVSDPVGSQQGEERPITPTVLGYEVMEERAKFTVWKVTSWLRFGPQIKMLKYLAYFDTLWYLYSWFILKMPNVNICSAHTVWILMTYKHLSKAWKNWLL